MVNMGKADTNTLRDHWTVVTQDGLPSAHVEHTLAIVKDGVYVVTADEETLVRVARRQDPVLVYVSRPRNVNKNLSVCLGALANIVPCCYKHTFPQPSSWGIDTDEP